MSAARLTARVTALAWTLALIALPSCRPAPPSPRADAVTPRHLVVVTIDTLRADRLGAYGNASVPTPNFDRIAREGVRAIDATAHVPITRPAHASLFTGLYPAEHGIRDNISLGLAADVPTLAEVLSARGFSTAAFVSSFVLARQSGLDRGFAHYDDKFDTGSGNDALFLNTVQRRGDHTIASLEQWLDARTPETRARRTALWVHLYDPHDPYEPPEPYAARFADRPYDGEVAWTDDLLGRLRAGLESRGLWDDALVVITADHGEALGEHGETGHGYFAYETTLKIPLLLRGPGLPANTTVDGTLRAIDVMPTVLELLGGAPAPKPITGQSVASSLRAGGPAISHTTYAESLTPLIHYQWSDLRVQRDGPWKYILAPRPELYDLTADPGETHDLSAAQPARARALRAALETQLRGERERAATASGTAAPAVSAEVLQKLGALGYVSPGASGATAALGADPKDKIAEFSTLNGLMRDGLTLLRQGRFADSAARLTALQKAGADNFQVHFYLGRALAGLGRMADAERSFALAAAAMPSFADAHLGVADARIARKDYRGAIAALERGQAAAPTDPSLFDRAGQVWERLGDVPRALAAYRTVMTLAPRDALVRWRAGELLLAQREPAQARALFQEATTLDPSVGDYWNSLGMVLGGDGQHVDAARAFREAATRDPRNPRFVYNLGLVLQRAHDPEARAMFERTLVLDPTFRPARDRLAELAR